MLFLNATKLLISLPARLYNFTYIAILTQRWYILHWIDKHVNRFNAVLYFIRIYLHTHIVSAVFFVSWMKDIKAERATAVIASPYSCCLLSCLISYMVCIRFLERDLHDIVAILNSSFHKFLGTTVKDMHSYLDYVT